MKTITRVRNGHDLVERSMQLNHFVKGPHAPALWELINQHDRAELAEITRMRRWLGKHNRKLALRRFKKILRRARGKVQVSGSA